MICYFFAGKDKPVVVESTHISAVRANPQGATELIATGLALYVESTVPEALELLGWPAIPKPENVDVPHVQGEGLPGVLLTCTMGNWKNEPTAYSYQWMSDEIQVGTNEASYTIGTSDVGHVITCVVTASNIGGSTAAPPSNGITVVDLAALSAGGQSAGKKPPPVDNPLFGEPAPQEKSAQAKE